MSSREYFDDWQRELARDPGYTNWLRTLYRDESRKLNEDSKDETKRRISK